MTWNLAKNVFKKILLFKSEKCTHSFLQFQWSFHKSRNVRKKHILMVRVIIFQGKCRLYLFTICKSGSECSRVAIRKIQKVKQNNEYLNICDRFVRHPANLTNFALQYFIYYAITASCKTLIRCRLLKTLLKCVIPENEIFYSYIHNDSNLFFTCAYEYQLEILFAY